MKLEDTHSGLERMERATCLQLLAEECVGRLIIVRGSAPEVFPVNYAMDGDAVVFRSDPGTKVTVGPRAPAAFEIDHLDRTTREGWSVIVFGRLEEVTRFDSTTWSRVSHLSVDPWAGGEKEHWMRLVPSRISGRRISRREPVRWAENRRTIGPGARSGPRSS